MLVNSLGSRDYTVLQTYILVVVVWMFVVHVILNVVLQLLNARGDHEE